MATTGRTEGSDLNAQPFASPEMAQLLEREPYLFDFFQGEYSPVE